MTNWKDQGIREVSTSIVRRSEPRLTEAECRTSNEPFIIGR
jgi:hypothetical protein